MMKCTVVLLTGFKYLCEVEKNSVGQALLDNVCDHLDVLERDYFGLMFYENVEEKIWLDPTKKIKTQMRNTSYASRSGQTLFLGAGPAPL
ncbi:band 4.1-like protein 2 [Nycticebus coucang]|uniref:band 4.1-like protein 2 n=1 Tax=Nycticebus coucang TaxID=9470 RepID=UPI00234D86D3|nr:band 4.1-like protein 2 [Nycticebus coucang]